MRLKGWICPKCNNVYSPLIQDCQGCNKNKKHSNEISQMPKHCSICKSFLCVCNYGGLKNDQELTINRAFRAPNTVRVSGVGI